MDEPTVFEALRATQLREVIQHYGEALRARRKGLDKLNVYPVPDGDTGTNMSLTVQSVLSELKGAAGDDMHTIASAISRGAIMGARGNSGAILAQVLRGIAESAKDKTALSPHDVAEGLERARKSAYESVLKPVEGTILTVLTAAAEAAKKSADEGHKLKEQMEHMRVASAEALARTPDLLPVLKQAGVVDAGGSGFLLFVDALRYVVTGEPIPGLTDAESGDGDDTLPGVSGAKSDIAELRYEVMFLLEGGDDGIPALRQAWSEIGDSIVVVGGDGLWNCHIHSDDIGMSIETALDYGRLKSIRVTDLLEQVGAEHGSGWFDETAGNAGSEIEDTGPASSAVVAVLNGDGLTRIYKSFGVQRFVTGGQTMNPSVAEILTAIESAPSASVIVLPNNKNIQAAAVQAGELSDKDVFVVPTTSVVQGLAALVAYDATLSSAVVGPSMVNCIDNVACGEVTRAVRASPGVERPDLPATGVIEEGDWLGIGPDGISVVADTLGAALCRLVETLTGDDDELLTLIVGDDATSEATNALHSWLKENRPGLEVELHEGGQPLYPYLLGVE